MVFQKRTFLTICLAFLGISIFAQKSIDLVLSDGTEVKLQNSNNKKLYNLYYYLPVNFRTATRDTVAEYSLMFYSESDDGSTDGAILHMLVTWGLTEAQIIEADTLLHQLTDSTSFVMGSVQLQADHHSFSISDNTDLGKILNRSLTSKSPPPILPGGKMALTFMLNKADANKLKELLEDKKELKKTCFYFKYKPDTYNQFTIDTNQLIFKIPFVHFQN